MIKKKKDISIDLQVLYDHFKNMNMNVENDDIDIDVNLNNLSPEIEELINSHITGDEIKRVVKKLKNGKSAGYDGILNEYIKYTLDDMLPIYLTFFNIILDTGMIPENWGKGIMIPIFKNKGSKLDPSSYRGITLNSCLSKTFSAIINDRLNRFSDEIDLITGAQAGFRKGFSTVDNIFVLYAIISLYFSFGKQLFCAFVDFKSAFDTVWRLGLWQKLQRANVQGKVFRVIYNMYQNVKTCVRKNEDCSGFFNCDVGVKQGENLSPFLFSLFLNDLESFLLQNNVQCLEQISEKCRENLLFYLKIFVILYADDTAIMSETENGLQNALSMFEQYCNYWKLTVNTNKTKIVIFSKRKYKPKVKFKLYGEEIDVQDSYTYLGITFNYNGNFCTAKKKLLEQANKSLYALYYKIRNLSLPIDVQLKLFDTLVAPILVYASEVWGFENKQNIEKMHLQFCKKILNLRNNTPNYMVYGELGRFPIEIVIKLRMVTFWNNLLLNRSKLGSILYSLMFKIQENNQSNFRWMTYIKSIFDETGLSFVWNDQLPMNKELIKSVVKQKLVDQFIQHWFSQLGLSSRGEFYALFKNEFKLEPYLLRLNKSDRIHMSKLRCSNLRFPVETGRWVNIPKQNRLCQLCNSNLIGDEFHYLFICTHHDITQLRNKFIPKYYTSNPSEYKMVGLLSYCNVQLYENVCAFIKKILKYF